ncbi:MAG: hypothetical protein PHC61_15230, partial [Chitinivibrionales bacterium]|nr:hypothetical protein [Chitinivibrionales bacterium]
CGNVLHVHDLADFVSEEAQTCGRNVAEYLRRGIGAGLTSGAIKTTGVVTGANLKYVVPNRCATGRESRFLMRALIVGDKGELIVRQGDALICKQALRRIRPAEMIALTLSKEQTKDLRENVPLEFTINL